MLGSRHTDTECISLMTKTSMEITPHRTNDAVMAKGKRLVTWSIRVDDELDAVVKRLAEKDLRTTSNYVEMIVRKHIADLGIEMGEKHPDKPEKPTRGRKT